MKKTRINLLTTRDDYIKIERSLQLLRIVAVSYFFIFIAVAIIFVLIQFLQNRNIQDLIRQKGILLSSLNNYKNEEAKLVFVARKVNAYDKFILDDARFLPYYNLLNSALETTSEVSAEASPSASLSSFTIDKERIVSFTLLFSSVSEMVDSFRYIESESFLQNFEQLSLSGLTLGSGQTENSLSFLGKFKPIADEAAN